MPAEKFDAIVVGAGPSGNACAYTLAKRGLKVLQIERGEYAGSKNVQGAILYADMLEKIIPDFREDAPLERHIIEQRMWFMDDNSYIGMHYRSDDFNEEKPQPLHHHPRAVRQVVLEEGARGGRAGDLRNDRHRSLLQRRQGDRRQDRPRGRHHLADVVILADGVNGLLGTRAGLRGVPKPETVALAVKEMHFLPSEVIEARFNVKGKKAWSSRWRAPSPRAWSAPASSTPTRSASRSASAA